MSNNPICPRCNCCSTYWDECEVCGGEGVDGHDCGEDSCCCADPEENLTCDYCQGAGGGWRCIGGCVEGKHEHEPAEATT